MALVLVQEDGGGDYTTLAAAVAANETDIEIQETWSAPETANIAIDDANTSIVATGAAKHPGYVGGSPTHYRLEDNSGGHVVTTVDSIEGVVIDGLDIHQTGTGSSDECVRAGGGYAVTVLTLKNCLIHGDRGANDQDGVYLGIVEGTINLENCIIYGFDRAGLHAQCYNAAARTQTWNVNSCTIWDCGEDGEANGGGITAHSGSGVTLNLNLFNTQILACSFNSNDDYNESTVGGTHNWDTHNSIDSDNSIASRDGSAHACLASRTIAETDQGAGNYVIVEDLDSPYDLRIQDLGSAKNNAQDMHTDATGAGMNIPAADIVGTNRPQNTNYDCGAFEIVAADYIPMIMMIIMILISLGSLNCGILRGFLIEITEAII